eukprot:726566-Ditylum_brightwellii.AAC.1
MLEDIARVQAEGLGVDDDNESAPENILSPSTVDMDSQPTSIWGEWDSRAICWRKSEGPREESAKLGGVDCRSPPSRSLDYFLLLLPTHFNQVVLEATNKI